MDTQTRIAAALAATPESHIATLFGERPSGSTWGRPFGEADWAGLLPRWKAFAPPRPVRRAGCAYFRAPLGDFFPNARLGAVPWFKVERAGLEGRCEARWGAHGPELVLPRGCVEEGTFPSFVSTATLIVGMTVAQGMHDGVEVVFTLHPGEPLLPWNGEHVWREGCEPGETTWDTQDFTAVKLI